MKKQPPASADDGAAPSSLASDSSDGDHQPRSSPRSGRRTSSARNRPPPTSLNWKQSNGNGKQFGGEKLTAFPKSSLAPSASDMALGKGAVPPSPRHVARSRWSMSILCLLVAILGITLLSTILRSLVTSQSDVKGCRMSYMRPSYRRFSEFDTEHTRFATKYSLYLYREQGIDDDQKLRGIPVLFIPGNAGSYKQVRPIAAEAANAFHHQIQHEAAANGDSGVRTLDFFTVDFNEDITAFHGQTLLDQAEYLNEAVRYILSLYSDPQGADRGSHLPDPTSVIILGHSMGGVVARAMLVQPNYQSNSINTIITMSAPHARPPVTFDGQIVQIYDEINDYWRHAYGQKWANNNPLWHVTLVSIAGGGLDTIVPSDYASLESLVPETHGFTVFTSGIPTVWTSMDHQAILWCDQFRKVVTRALYEVVDVSRASQTKPRAERMRVFEKWFLTGMEPTAEKAISLAEATTLLTLDGDSNSIVPAGERLFLNGIGAQAKPSAHLVPIPPQESHATKRFTLLTDSSLTDGGAGHLEVLLCSVFPLHPSSSSFRFYVDLDLSDNAKGSTKLACKNAISDVILLPMSTLATKNPFYGEREPQIRPFSYLQYEYEHLSDHQFVAVVDKATLPTRNFVLAEFRDHGEIQKSTDATFSELILFGFQLRLPADRPLSTEISLPAFQSSLLAFNLDLRRQPCNGGKDTFEPFVRQYLEHPYESKYFVNVSRANIALHGAAPYMPPPMKAQGNDGLTLAIWSDPTCDSALDVSLQVDIFGSFGKLYMRYRTVFAAFPLLIVTLVLRKQFRVYDTTGVFISFSESLDLSLRQSIPLLLLSLTLLSMSLGGASISAGGLTWRKPDAAGTFPIEFHRNELLIGTDDPVFWFLIPLIGIICVGVCAVLHYLTLALTGGFSLVYRLLGATAAQATGEEYARILSPTFTTSTPRRRMVTTAVLLFLVSTFIPYQFAYLVAYLVQLFTVVRALSIDSAVSSTANSNYYHYAHSVLILMLWVLPINLPILAVWIRNLAVHWLTPFSSHHNVLSIMPFILLVENLTTGKMIPQLTNGLRHVTSILLFGTALCAAIYGVCHAYILHYLVNIVAGWLVIIHSTSDSWTLSSIGAMFEGNPNDSRNRHKAS